MECNVAEVIDKYIMSDIMKKISTIKLHKMKKDNPFNLNINLLTITKTKSKEWRSNTTLFLNDLSKDILKYHTDARVSKVSFPRNNVTLEIKDHFLDDDKIQNRCCIVFSLEARLSIKINNYGKIIIQIRDNGKIYMKTIKPITSKTLFIYDNIEKAMKEIPLLLL